MKSKYFFPIPHIPIRPAALLTTAAGGTGGAGPLDNYGLNVGPMVVSALFRFVNGRIEMFMGRVLSEAHRRQRKARKAARKEEERKEAEILKQERRAARTARRAERERRRKAAEAAAAATTSGSNKAGEEGEMNAGNGNVQNTKKETIPESSEIQISEENVVGANIDSNFEEFGGMDELD